MIIQKQKASQEDNKKDDDDSENGTPQNKGTLILDATCTPADIKFPQDVNLLNDTREQTEKIIDELHQSSSGRKPRTYRNKARKDFLSFSKSKKRTRKITRKAIRKQLQYIRRNLGHIGALVEKGAQLTEKQMGKITVIELLYDQQKEMYEQKKHIKSKSISIFANEMR